MTQMSLGLVTVKGHFILKKEPISIRDLFQGLIHDLNQSWVKMLQETFFKVSGYRTSKNKEM